MKPILFILLLVSLSSCTRQVKMEIIHLNPPSRPIGYGLGITEFYYALKLENQRKRGFIIHKNIIDKQEKKQIIGLLKRTQYYKLKPNWNNDLFDYQLSNVGYLASENEFAYAKVDSIGESNLIDIKYCIILKKRKANDSIFIGQNYGMPNFMKYNQDYYMVSKKLYRNVDSLFDPYTFNSWK